MKQKYLKWNEYSLQWLWWLVILGVIAVLPIAYERIQTERTARQVEFVFDYRDLLDIADYKSNPRLFIEEQLQRMKESGISSMAVYESTLDELQKSRHIRIFSAKEAMALTQTPWSDQNFTHILFADADVQRQLQPLIERGFARIGVSTRPWSFQNQPGMVIEMGMEDASIKPLDPDPITMRMLKDQGFQVVVRLSNRIQPFSVEEMDALLAQLRDLGVRRIVVDGPAVPGYDPKNPEQLKKMGELMNKYRIGLASIELLKVPQQGFSTLAKEIRYNVVRLHSFTEQDGDKIAGNPDDPALEPLIRGVSDRFVLAVKDRNIRMIFLNARPYKNLDRGMYTDPLESIYASLSGHDGAVNRVQREGFTLGPAKQLALVHSGWQKAAKAVLLLSSVALIAITLSYFARQLRLLLFVIGTVGSAGLYVLSASLYGQAAALLTAICAPTLAVIMAVRTADRVRGTPRNPIGFSVFLLVRTTLISLIGAVFVIGLLNHITYFLGLQLFRGVSLLFIMPVVLSGCYVAFFHESTDLKRVFAKIKNVLSAHIRVLWVVLAAVAALVFIYYLSRSGNEGQVSSLERMFRSFLEDTLKVRPRTKEFLIAHPLFILGGYLVFKYRSALYLIFAGVIGQLSLVNTFTHLHTPVWISLIRTAYGIGFGIVIGLLLIAVWEIVARGWRKWAPLLKE